MTYFNTSKSFHVSFFSRKARICKQPVSRQGIAALLYISYIYELEKWMHCPYMSQYMQIAANPHQYRQPFISCLLSPRISLFNQKLFKAMHVFDSHMHYYLATGQCQEALGISDGRIKNAQLFASSSADETQQPFHARINKTIKGSRGGWCSAFPDNTEFIEVDFLKPFLISGLYVMQLYYSVHQLQYKLLIRYHSIFVFCYKDDYHL